MDVKQEMYVMAKVVVAQKDMVIAHRNRSVNGKGVVVKGKVNRPAKGKDKPGLIPRIFLIATVTSRLS
jgi:hypothetical protein